MLTRSPRTRLIAALVVLLALLPMAQHAAASGGVVGPRAYYLALGDSLAYGMQPNNQNNLGYADDFYANLQPQGTQNYVNMACVGETSTTFINGGCLPSLIWPTKYFYLGPQLNAAVTFIQQHPGQVSPVTLDIGADDFGLAFNVQTCTVSNLGPLLHTLETNYQTILSQLHTALAGSGDLITMSYYFPYQNVCPNLIPYVQYANGRLAAIARQNGALVAPVFQAFGGPTVPNPNLCTYTWICQTNTYLPCILLAALCIHATTEGYAVMAKTIETTAGY